MIFMVAVLALMVVLIFGATLGWTSLTTLLLAVVAVTGTVGFVLWERRQGHPFVDFSLFANTTFTGATLSNFVLNATIGLLIVSQQLLQKARPEGHPDAVSAGAGAGIYKMASSLGSAIGAAVSLAIFTGLTGRGTIGNVVTYSGVQDNVDLRQAGLVVMIVNLLLVAVAVIAIVVTVPRGGGTRDLGEELPPAPQPQPTPDAEREALLARLAALPTEELVEMERTRLLLEMSRLDPEVLRRLLRGPDR